MGADRLKPTGRFEDHVHLAISVSEIHSVLRRGVEVELGQVPGAVCRVIGSLECAAGHNLNCGRPKQTKLPIS